MENRNIKLNIDKNINEMIISGEKGSKYNFDNSISFNTNTDNSSYIEEDNFIDSLRDSIRSKIKAYKKNTTKNEFSQGPKKKDISEKEKIIEHYKNLRSNSRIDMSTNFIDVSQSHFRNKDSYEVNYCDSDLNDIKNKIEETPNSQSIIKNIPCSSDNTSYLNENEFVIYDCFKNMLKNKNKISNISNKNLTNNFNYQPCETNHFNFEKKFDINLDNRNIYNKNENYNYDQPKSFLKSNHKFIYDFTNQMNSCNTENKNFYKQNKEISCSLINELETENNNENETNDIHTKHNNYKNKSNNVSVNNTQSERLNTQYPLNYTVSPNKTCKNLHCRFYKKKYRIFKKSKQYYKNKYIKEKKLSEMLNMKIFYYENNKILDKLNLSNVSSVNKEDEIKLTKKVYDKLQDNYNLFEKLENDIINKDEIIRKQNEICNYQKATINKLLEQFNIFTSQGNFLINDLLLLKQNVYDKNFKDVTKDMEEIELKINEYSYKIKEFSDKTRLINKETVKDSNISNEKFMTIDEITNNNEQNELSFNLSKSNMKTSNTLSNLDRSLVLMDLSSNMFLFSQNEKEEDFVN